MGLESSNFIFRSKEKVEYALRLHHDLTHIDGTKYAYKKDGDYWIDIEFQNPDSVSIRVTLCNPTDSVIAALDKLLSYLFRFKEGTLMDMSTKEVYNDYTEETSDRLKDSYLKRKKIFEEMYGNYIAAIGTEEFYRRQNEISE